MKLSVDRKLFHKAFSAAAAATPSKSPKPILQCVKLEASQELLTLTGTDLEVGVRINCVAGVEEAGETLLPVDRLTAILRNSDDDMLVIVATKDAVTVKGERSQFKLPTMPAEEFPLVAQFKADKYFEILGRGFRSALDRTLYAIDTESSRYALGGVLFEFVGKQAFFIGCDGRRLAKMQWPVEPIGEPEAQKEPTIVLEKAVKLMRKIFADDETLKISVSPNDVIVAGETATIYSRLVEGRYPKWRDVLPKRQDATKIEMAVDPLLRAVKQASIVTTEASKVVDFRFEKGRLTLVAESADVGKSEVELPIAYDGKLAISLSPKYVADFLNVVDDETITIEIKDEKSAAVCRTADGYEYVIMPLSRDR
jgi:DNA polymerase III subunit beta